MNALNTEPRLTEPITLRAVTPVDDDALVARVRTGDRAAFELLMRRHNQRVFRVARAILKHDADAEDAAQQAWVSAFTHLDQYRRAAAFATWLTRIVVNEASARVRRRTRQAEVVRSEPSEVMMTRAEIHTPEEQASRRELTRLLEASIDELPEPYRVVLMLREVQELDTAETAACLSLSDEAVRVRLHRAKKLLREAMFSRVTVTAPETFAFLGERCDRIVAAVLGRTVIARAAPEGDDHG